MTLYIYILLDILITRCFVHRDLLSHTHLQSVFIIGSIILRQQELLGVHLYPTLLLVVTWVRECLDYLLRTIYLEGCCKAVLGAPSLDRYFRQPALTRVFVIFRLIVVIAAPCFGSETHSFAMPGGAHLQSMLTPVPLWAA